MRDKEPRNEQGQQHGYWEVYHDNGKLWYNGCFINDEPLGYYEWNCGKHSEKKYYAR